VNEQSGPGPTHVVNGVPVGYAHTEAGAVAAATNYLMVVDGALITQPDKYRAAINTLSAPEGRGKLRQVAEADMTGAQYLITYAAQGRSVVRRDIPLAYSVPRYNADSAQVSIWAESMIAVDGAVSFREGWTTTTVTCEWSSGDWKLSDIAASGPDSFGPVPTPVEAPGQSVSLPAQLSNYRSYLVDVPT
jgi:hypothetical protein